MKHGLYTTNGKHNLLINNNIIFWAKMGEKGEALSERPSLLGLLVKQVKNTLYLSIAIIKLLIKKDIIYWGTGDTFLQKVRAESFTCFTASPKAVAKQKTHC